MRLTYASNGREADNKRPSLEGKRAISQEPYELLNCLKPFWEIMVEVL